MKLQYGICLDGEMILTMGAGMDASRLNVLTMNAICGKMDAVYQSVKKSNDIQDESYIAFDYIAETEGRE